ncbi:MAG: hypothetical protein JO025_20520 [Verrucomicrobia bacterium]|nr:hypothetical protein [Verrucomicrobiota bacterium]
MSQLKPARELGLARSTVQYPLGKGMPASLDGARQWLTDYRADKSFDVSTPVASNPVAGDAFEDRLNRLRNSEKAIAGEIEAREP